MRNVRLHALSALLVIGFALAGAPAVLAQTEVEPNQPCSAAQDLTSATLPFAMTGEISSTVRDIDFYRFTGTPGDLITIRLEGIWSQSGALAEPSLGVFGSGCSLQARTDGSAPSVSLDFVVPEDGAFVVAATAYGDWDFTGHGAATGTYRLSMERQPLARAIRGRVVDARTGSAVLDANVTLLWCPDGCVEVAGGMLTDGDGGFRFENGGYALNIPLHAGEYSLFVDKGTLYQRAEVASISVAEGQDLDLGSVALQPIPVAGSISGRVVDVQTGVPLSGQGGPLAYATLERCEYPGFCSYVDSQYADSQGSFRFVGNELSPLFTGTYRIRASAQQYLEGAGESFTVGEGEDRTGLTVALQSFPVRIDVVEPCGPVPATGGDCHFKVQVTNGGSSRLQGQTWSVVTKADFFGPTVVFQAGSPKAVSLDPAASMVVPLSFHVPAAVPDGSTICVRTYVSHRPSELDVVGSRGALCLSKGAQGFTVLPEKEKDQALRKMGGRP